MNVVFSFIPVFVSIICRCHLPEFASDAASGLECGGYVGKIAEWTWRREWCLSAYSMSNIKRSNHSLNRKNKERNQSDSAIQTHLTCNAPMTHVIGNEVDGQLPLRLPKTCPFPKIELFIKITWSGHSVCTSSLFLKFIFFSFLTVFYSATV